MQFHALVNTAGPPAGPPTAPPAGNTCAYRLLRNKTPLLLSEHYKNITYLTFIYYAYRTVYG